jgi:quercetin dioxygenase-like cupin family protein
MNMRRILIVVLAGLFLVSTGTLAAAQSKVIGDARSIDTKYAAPFNVNLEKWFAAHPVESGKMMRMEPIFQTPRVTVLAATNKGQTVDLHYHRFADELSFVFKGQCEKYVDGKWVLVKPGTVHYNPRGVIHATRVVGNEPLLELIIFTPAPPPDDRVFLNSEITTAKPGVVVGDWSLLDTQHKKGHNFDLDEFYATHPIQAGQTARIEAAMGTLRNQLMIAQRPTLAVHYHGSADELIYTYKGLGEMYINGEWGKLYPGDIHFCPRGFIHGIHPAGDGEFKIFAVFTPPQAGGSDRIFVDLK